MPELASPVMRPLALTAALLAGLWLAPAGAIAAWTWPVQGEVSTHYRNGEDPYAAGQHRGIDIAAPAGHPVVAATGGTVTFAGTVGLSGLTVAVRTGDGRFDTSYLHLGSIDVRPGQRVAAGQRLGAVGTSGRRSIEEPHLHFGVRDAGSDHAYHDPLEFLPPLTAPRPAPESPPPGPLPVLAPVRPRPAHLPAPTEGPLPAPGPAPRPGAAPRPSSLPAPVPTPLAAPSLAPAPLTVPDPSRSASSAGAPARLPSPVGGPAARPVPLGVAPVRPPAARRYATAAPTGEERAASAATQPVEGLSKVDEAPRVRSVPDRAESPQPVELGPAPRGAPAGASRHASHPSPEARPTARGTTGGAVDLGWAAACAGLLVAAVALGHPKQAGAAAGRGRAAMGAVLRPLTGPR